MKRRVLLAAMAAAWLAGCRGGERTGADVAARAGASRLTVARLAALASSAADLPLRSDVIESLAMRWVEFSLLGQRAAAGDHLEARRTILAVAWPDVRAAIVDSFRTVRLAGRVRVAPAQVDSAFGAGDSRFLKQVLKQVTAGASARQRDSLRAVLGAIRARLVAGGSWEEANAQNDDLRSRAANGVVGLVRRGETVPAFERAAFALAPGQYSGIVATEVGFHVIYRPTLEEARGALAAALEARLAEPLDAAYGMELFDGRHVRMSGGVPEAVRYTIASPLRARQMNVALATYDGGAFTVADLARYLQFLPLGFHQQVLGAPDTQLVDLARSFVLRELEWREAARAGVTLPEARYRDLAAAYTAQVDRILAATGLDPDSLAATAATHGGRLEEAAQRVDRFLAAALGDPRMAAGLPPGLASYLLERAKWEVSPQGVEQALLEAAMLRSTGRGPTGNGPARRD